MFIVTLKRTITGSCPKQDARTTGSDTAGFIGRALACYPVFAISLTLSKSRMGLKTAPFIENGNANL